MADSDPWGDFYDAVYSQDNPAVEPYAWIQWKGTDVCMDVHCNCGCDAHVDATFPYYYRCPKCKRLFAVGQNIKLILLSDAQVTRVESEEAHVIIKATEASR